MAFSNIIRDNWFGIEFSGIDGAGKTSLINKLQQIESLKASLYFKKTIRENVERLLRLYSQDYESVSGLLTGLPAMNHRIAGAFDFLNHYDKFVREAMSENNILFLDRWKTCVRAYSSFPAEAENITSILLRHVPEASITIYLEVDPDIAIERIKRRGNLKMDENIEVLKAFSEGYKKVIQAQPNRLYYIESSSEDATFKKVKEIILSHIAK